MMGTALIIVDVQVDFCEGGRLGVEGGNKVASQIALFAKIVKPYDLVVFTRDFHDQYSDNDGHFSDTPDFKTSWPVHCTIGSPGVKLHPALRGIKGRLFSKGYKANDYSGFKGRACNESLDTWLRKHDIDSVDIVGIAGDYCVRETALDAIKLGYKTEVVGDLVASVGGDEATRDTVETVRNVQQKLAMPRFGL